MQKSKYKHTRRLLPLLVAATVLALSPITAQAYLDPTTGSMLISAIVGLFASLVLAIKTYWFRIKSFFKRKPNAPASEDETK
jgi:hypothetical protein